MLRTRVKNRVRSLLQMSGLRGTNPFTASGRTWLKQQKLSEATRESVAQLLAFARRYRRLRRHKLPKVAKTAVEIRAKSARISTFPQRRRRLITAPQKEEPNPR